MLIILVVLLFQFNLVCGGEHMVDVTYFKSEKAVMAVFCLAFIQPVSNWIGR